MTTKAAEALYLAQHNLLHEGKGWAVYNPNNRDILPTIFGFNNGGGAGFMHAQLIAEDGTHLGSHLCSSEGYMPADLGILEGTRSDRHEGFRKHYPDGYRMEFVPSSEIDNHERFQAALALAIEYGKAKGGE